MLHLVGSSLLLYLHWWCTIKQKSSVSNFKQPSFQHNIYQLLYVYIPPYIYIYIYIYGIPPDDELQICPKHVEVDWRNKLRINSASSWFSLHKCFNVGDINAWSRHEGIFKHLTIRISLVPFYSAYCQYSDKSTIESDVLILETGNVQYRWNFTLITFDSITEVSCSWKEQRVTVTSNIQPYKRHKSFVIDCLQLNFPRTVLLVPLFRFCLCL